MTCFCSLFLRKCDKKEVETCQIKDSKKDRNISHLLNTWPWNISKPSNAAILFYYSPAWTHWAKKDAFAEPLSVWLALLWSEIGENFEYPAENLPFWPFYRSRKQEKNNANFDFYFKKTLAIIRQIVKLNIQLLLPVFDILIVTHIRFRPIISSSHPG